MHSQPFEIYAYCFQNCPVKNHPTSNSPILSQLQAAFGVTELALKLISNYIRKPQVHTIAPRAADVFQLKACILYSRIRLHIKS